MRHAAWALLVLAAFLLGLYLGQRQARLPGLDAPGGARPNPVAVAPSASLPGSRPSGAEPAGSPGIAPAAAARSEAAWAAALASLDRLSRRGEGAAAAEIAGALLAEIRSLAQAGGGATAAARLDAYLRRNPGLSFVARSEGRVVATVQCGHDARRGYLHHLAVAQHFRRQGLGAALVERSLARLAELGIPQCNIYVLGDNEEGLKFWEATGWEPGTPEGLMLLHKHIRGSM